MVTYDNMINVPVAMIDMMMPMVMMPVTAVLVAMLAVRLVPVFFVLMAVTM